MRKYWRIIWISLKNSYTRDKMIPGYVISGLLFQIFEILVTIVFFNVIFNSTESLAGWNFYQILFLYAFSKIIIGVHSLFTKKGIQSITSEQIRYGQLDFYLTKPVNPMILVTISQPRFYYAFNILLYIGVTIFSIIKSGIAIGAMNVFWLLFLFVISIVLYYFLQVITVIPTFWFIKLWSLQDLMGKLNGFMRYPMNIFPSFLKIAFFIAFPVMATSYIPAVSLFYAPRASSIMFMIGITVVFYFITNWLWKLGLKNYASASS